MERKSARLDSTAFPHIYERVIANSPYELLLRLRLVNRASLMLADSVLFEHVAFSHKDGAVNDPRIPSKSLPSQVYARSLSAASASSSLRRLPVPAFMSGTFGILTVPPHGGWEHTRVLDFETAVRVLGPYFEDLVEFPVLHTVRRRAWIADLMPTHTFLDVLRVPPPGQFDSRINTLVRGVKRHVVLVLYDPLWEGLAAPFKVNVPFWDVDTHAVFLFRPCPRDERFLAPAPKQLKEGRTETFLRFFYSLVADRYHASYTLVGLENIPPYILAAELDVSSDDLLLAAAYQSTGHHDHWARVVKDHTIEAIRALSTDAGEFLSDDEEFLELDDVVEVLTCDEYRAREGEDVWVRESFGDVLPGLLGS
ncbi:uncharacterized protein CcaverHIS019_0111890 [Cutaneotrichosporon cavernicola]|uniref:Uncharacterized protein n=1 Tax=Cutaneotrichosporon cavernicola TaxID=279322 RepID=A0AA48ICQ3_9TREE|nr:uncharacterized protein CcaverHIS019_0111890 [Cutaneotrichosporon cavernicola]BEI88471.1 hypothetical protein CcaverHIS019_0111890 [Cutaneotrichosporon cavernicola]